MKARIGVALSQVLARARCPQLARLASLPRVRTESREVRWEDALRKGSGRFCEGLGNDMQVPRLKFASMSDSRVSPAVPVPRAREVVGWVHSARGVRVCCSGGRDS